MTSERAIFQGLKDLGQLRPWDHIQESQLLAIQVPRQKEPYFVSVVGHIGLEVGLLIFKGKLALAYFIEQLNMEGAQEEVFYGQDMVMVSFEDRERLTSYQYDRIKASGVSFRGRKSWPKLIDFQPGYVMADLEDQQKLKDLALVLDYIQDSLAFFIQDGVDQHFRTWSQIPLRDYRQSPVQTRPYEDFPDLYLGVTLDLLGVKRANFSKIELTRARLLPVQEATWQLGFYRMPLAVEDDLTDDLRPTFPYFIVISQETDYRLISLDVFQYEDYHLVQLIFLQALFFERKKPAKVQILEKGSDLVLSYLGDLLSQLDLDFDLVARLPFNESLAADIINLEYAEDH